MMRRDTFLSFAWVLVFPSFHSSTPLTGKVTLDCLENEVTVNYEQANKFDGAIYVEHHSKDVPCWKNITNTNKTMFHVPIGTCGTAKTDEHVVFDVTIMNDPILVTNESKRYRMNCSYNPWAESVISIVYEPPSNTIYSKFIPEKSGRIINSRRRKFCRSLLCKLRHKIINKIFNH